MRLRHKKGAEEEIMISPYCIHSKYISGNSPLEIELGMGKGKFIIEKALSNPNINYVGVEKYATVVLKAIDKLKALTSTDLGSQSAAIRRDFIQQLGSQSAAIRRDFIQQLGSQSAAIPKIDNLVFLCDDVEKLLDYFDTNSVDKIYLNFSDPWPKKRHENRRITHHKFLSLYEKLLKSDGIIEFKTDNIDLFNFSLEEIKLSNFILIDKTYDLHNDQKLNIGNVMTEYEEKFSKKGNPICKYIIKKSIEA